MEVVNPLPPLPGGSYFRATTLGEGAFGSVMIVYNDDGEEFAAKRFEESEDGDLDCATCREIGVLRLLSQYSHRNIVPLFDVSESLDDGVKRLLMIMPKYALGNLYDAIEGGALVCKTKDQLSVIHGMLEGTRFLHENCGLMHRDLKSDNVMLEMAGERMVPVLIDFSLARFFRDPVFSALDEDQVAKKKNKKKDKKDKDAKKKKKDDGEGVKLTKEVGTATYIAPELVYGEPYNEKADVWSLGVICTEILTKQVVQVEKDKEAFKQIEQMKGKLKADSPMGKMLHGMLTVDTNNRLSCRQALDAIRSLTDKLGLHAPEGLGDDTTTTSTTTSATGGGSRICVPQVAKPCGAQTLQLCKTWADTIEYSGQSRDAASYYAAYMENVKGQADFFHAGAGGGGGNPKFEALCAVLLAGKIWESELHEIWELDEDWDPSLKRWNPQLCIEKELEIAKAIDYQFYLRK